MRHDLELGIEKPAHAVYDRPFNSEIDMFWAGNKEYTSSISTELSVVFFLPLEHC